MFANHLRLAAKLLLAAFTKITASASDEIVNTNAIARREVGNPCANFFHSASNFVPECHRQRINFGNAGAIMTVRVTDSRSSDPNQNVGRTNFRNRNVLIFERFSDPE
jgi:hypothetical protein